MTASYIVDQVSGETPSLDYFTELKEILRSFGVEEEVFDSLAQTAQVFLVGQYMQLRKAEDLVRSLSKRLERADRDIRRLRLQRDHLRNFLQDHGVPERELAVFNSNPILPAISKPGSAVQADGKDEETNVFRSSSTG